MIKKISIVSILTFILLTLTSCSVQNGTVIKGTLKATNNSIEGKYESFDGKYYKKLKLNKSDTLESNSVVNITDGDIQLLLLDEENNEISNLKDEKTITIPEDGYYYFTAVAKNHSGDFKLNWNIK